MTKLSVVLVACLFLSACGTDHESYTIFQPAAPSTAQKQPPAPAGGSVAPAQPGQAVTYPWFTVNFMDCLAPCTIKVVFEIKAAPQAFHFAKPFASHGDDPDGGPTNDRPKEWFRVESGPTDYAQGQSGVTVLAFDTRQVDCGRVQLDQDFVYGGGWKTDTAFTHMYRTGRRCVPETPKTPTCGTVPGYIHVGSVEVTDKMWEVDGYNAYVNVPVEYMNVSDPHVVELHWQNGALSNIKTTKAIVPMCDDVPRDASFNYFGHDVLHRKDHWAVYTTVVR